jgi:RNA polymerase sigma factor (sigma-70 family)
MPTSQMSEVLQHLRRTVLRPEGAGLTDGQLLENFVSRRDPAALEDLLRRHGPMVWGVCRRVLGNYHDAEDAFQATFLVLVRKAASIQTNTGNWLYGVAHQTALKARASRAKRQERERRVTHMPEPAAAEQDAWGDLQGVLDQELSRLPEKYRTVIVLCDLEGKTSKEAARQLGLPQGTVASRLARGRGMLAKRLARHGLTVSGGALAVVLSEKAASASVPTSVMSAAIKGLTSVATGEAAAGVISGTVATLTEGVLKAMLWTKLKIAAALVLMFAFMGAGAGRLLLQTRAAGRAEADQSGEKEAPPKNPALVKLQGTWMAVTAEANGHQVPEKVLKATKPTLVISGDTFTATALLDKNGEVTWTGKIQLDSTKQPLRFDVLEGRLEFAKTKGVMKAVGVKGIYELKGDTLKVCYGPGRPTEFKTKPDSHQKLYVFKREKPKEDKSDKKRDQQQLQGTWSLVEVKCNGPFGLWEGGQGGKYKWVIADSSLTIVWDDGKREQKYKVRLDPTPNPKKIDLTLLSTNVDGSWLSAPELSPFPGIYELDGNQLRVHYQKGSGPRPTGFDFPRQRGNILLVLKRDSGAKPAKPIEERSRDSKSDKRDKPPAKNDKEVTAPKIIDEVADKIARGELVLQQPPGVGEWRPWENEQRLQLAAGTHTIRVALGLGVMQTDKDGNLTAFAAKKSITLFSRTVEFVIEKGKAKDEQPDWGEAVDGVRIRLRPDNPGEWSAGAVPTFQLDLWNQGKDPLGGCRIEQACMLEIDGKWYHNTLPVNCPVSFLKPGPESASPWFRVRLDRWWVAGKAPWLVGVPPAKAEPSPPIPGPSQPLELPPPGPANGMSPGVPSNPVRPNERKGGSKERSDGNKAAASPAGLPFELVPGPAVLKSSTQPSLSVCCCFFS